MAGPRSPTSPVTAQLILQRRRIISFWCCAAFQQRSNEWMLVLPQTRSRSFHDVEKLFRLNDIKRFKNIQCYGWVVLLLTRPSSFHGVEDLFVWMFCSHVKTFKFMAGPRSSTSSVTAQLISQRWKIISFWYCADFQQRSNERLVVLPQTRSKAFHGVENFFYLDRTKRFKDIGTYGWAVLPQTRPSSFHGVEEHFGLDVMQLCKNIQVCGWAALPKIPCHGPAHFAALKNHFLFMLCRFSTTFKWTHGRATPNTVQSVSRCWRLFLSGRCVTFQKHSNLWLGRAPPSTASFIHGVEKPFRLDVMQPCKNIQVYGLAALPNIACHGLAHFVALKNHFVLMLCRLSTTFKWTDVRVSPNTVQLITRC